ncbi:MAG: TIR domain-containing protein [Candidatus Korobacteraceae bacterium]
MARPKKVFIASSKEAMPVSLAIKDRLHKRLKELGQDARFTLWTDSFTPSEGTLKTIVDHACASDFAIILLTEDDPLEKRGTPFKAPRDNTIFELGLFIGALGRDPKRSFMVCGADKNALPTDLAGCTLIPIKGKDPKVYECSESVDEAVASVSDAIQNMDCYRHPSLCTIEKQELADKERAKLDGGDLLIQREGVAVVVNSIEPVEQFDPEFSKTVLKNMQSGARYEYFYGDFEKNISPTSNLVLGIAAAGLMQPDMETKELFARMLENLGKVRDNLDLMRENLSIHFRKRPPLQFCVHNATTEGRARCYLRYEENFVPWTDGREAAEMAAELLDSCVVDKSEQDACIFHSTRDVLLNERRLNKILVRGDGDKSEAAAERAAKEKAAIADRRGTILRLIKKRFPPDLHEDVSKVCLGT